MYTVYSSMSDIQLYQFSRFSGQKSPAQSNQLSVILVLATRILMIPSLGYTDFIIITGLSISRLNYHDYVISLPVTILPFCMLLVPDINIVRACTNMRLYHRRDIARQALKGLLSNVFDIHTYMYSAFYVLNAQLS